MLITIKCAKCIGIEALEVTVEVNISNGIGIHLVGLADVTVKESLLRTVTALQTMGFRVPGKKIVINLAPADMYKQGGGYDVPIALGIIAASEQLHMPGLMKYIIMGELGLDGTVRPIRGALPISEMARNNGYSGCILPYSSALETVEFIDHDVYGVHSLHDVLRIVCEKEDYSSLLIRNQPHSEDALGRNDLFIPDFSQIVGQQGAKRGLEIAAAGGHDAILVGPPGCGKSSLAKAMCHILPPMTKEEALQTSKIYSVAGKWACGSQIRERPFRAPHSSTTVAAMIGGGGGNISPGEISLAHNGILFADEFCEISRQTIQALRIPMEERKITLSRLKAKVEYPAGFTLIAATNPCPCGYYGEGDRCTCSVASRRAYLEKIKGPLADRIDIQILVHPVPPSALLKKTDCESSAEIASRVRIARRIQQHRFLGENIFCNAGMTTPMLERYCHLDENSKQFMEKIMNGTGMSARAYSKILKISRTIADLEMARNCQGEIFSEGKDDGKGFRDLPIRADHLAEAASFRFLDRN